MRSPIAQGLPLECTCSLFGFVSLVIDKAYRTNKFVTDSTFCKENWINLNYHPLECVIIIPRWIFMENQKILTAKILRKMRKPPIGVKLFVPTLFLAFFSGMAAVVFALVTFLRSPDEEINPGLLYTFITAVILFMIGLLGFNLPKVYSRTWVRALNEKLYQETFGSSPLPNPPKIQKDLLSREKIEQQSVESFGTVLAFSYPGESLVFLCDIQGTSEIGWDNSKDAIGSALAVQNSSSDDLGKVELRSTLPVLFQGTYLRLENPLFSFSHRLEIRERRDSISPSSFYTEEAVIESLAFGDFDVYCDDLEFAKAFLSEERKKTLMDFASTMSRGVVLTVLPKALVFEVYGVMSDAQPIYLNEETPTLSYEEKKERIAPYLPLISTFLRNTSNEKS